MDPLLVTVAFQAWLTVWPLAKVQVTVQPLIAALPAVTLHLALEAARPLADDRVRRRAGPAPGRRRGSAAGSAAGTVGGLLGGGWAVGGGLGGGLVVPP